MSSFKTVLSFFVIAASLCFSFAGPARAALAPGLLESVERIYNADFAAAGRAIEAHVAAHPSDPAGFLVRGMLSEWDQVINNKKRALNPKIQQDYQKANDLALAAWEADKGDVDKMVLLGNTYMYVAKKLVDNGLKMRGGFALKKAKELMLQAIAKEPGNADAYMALGVFNYFSANVPGGFKFLASLLGFNGEEAKGIEYLRRAAGTPGLTQGDAGYLLVYIFDDKEKNYASALESNEAMKRRYPDNPAFQYETGEILFRQKQYAASRAEYEKFFAFCGAKPKGFCNDKYLFLSHYFTTWSYIEEKNYPFAKKHIGMAVKLNDGQYADRNVDLDLWAGILERQNGNKAKAAEYFRKVEAQKSRNQRAWEEAKKELASLGA